MAISTDTLRAMLRDFNGFELSEDELELVRPELESYMAEVENLRELDLYSVMSSRLLSAKEGGSPDA